MTEKYGIQWSPQVSLGGVLTTLIVLITAAIAYGSLQRTVNSHDTRLERLDATQQVIVEVAVRQQAMVERMDRGDRRYEQDMSEIRTTLRRLDRKLDTLDDSQR